jgi:hypothetical protein
MLLVHDFNPLGTLQAFMAFAKTHDREPVGAVLTTGDLVAHGKSKFKFLTFIYPVFICVLRRELVVSIAIDGVP